MEFRWYITFLLSIFIFSVHSQNYDAVLDSIWAEIPINPDEAEKRALKYLNDEDVKKSNVLMAKFNNLLGAIYTYRLDYIKAVEHFRSAIVYNRIINNKRGENVSLFNIGTIYYKINETKKALIYFNKSLIFFEKMNDTNSLANIYNNIGLCYQRFMDYNKSLFYVKKAFDLFTKNNDIQNVLLTMLNLAELYNDMGMKDSALRYYYKCVEISEKHGDINSKFSALYNILNIDKKKNDSIRRKILSFNFNELKDEYKLIYLNEWIDIYLIKKDFKNAFYTYQKLISIRDSIKNENKEYEARLLLVQNEFNEMRRIDSIKTSNEKKLAALKLEKQKAENQRNNLLKWSFLVISIIISFFLFLLFTRFKIIRKQKNIIEEQQKITTHQKELIEEKQKEILDSINYAQRIQNALINEYKSYLSSFSAHFMLYFPKDIVSGDFIWCTQASDYLFVSCCDSTGHGVPGSYMSLLNMAFLSEAVNEKNILVPAEILNYVRNRLISSISRNKENKDGFDGSVIRFPIENGRVIPGEMQWASANQRIVRIKNNESEILSYDRMPVGYYENIKPFSNYSDTVQKNEIIVLSTDGYYDQFGGEKNKKFTFKRFLQLLNSANMAELHHNLEIQFINWKSSNIQTDDVCVICFKI